MIEQLIVKNEKKADISFMFLKNLISTFSKVSVTVNLVNIIYTSIIVTITKLCAQNFTKPGANVLCNPRNVN